MNNNKGIWVYNSSRNDLINNNASNNNEGIRLGYSSSNIIKSNTISENGGEGIILDGSSNNILENNICKNNIHGIFLQCNSSNNLISSNTIYENRDQGILLWESSNNNIQNNVALGNNYGIRLGYALNNAIYLNNFINNTYNVHSSNSTNIWNSPEPETYTYDGNTCTSYLGNYWDNYTGSDADGNGIGDTPYGVNSDKDNYPLIGPFENYVIAPVPEWRKDIEIGDILWARGGSVLRVEGHVGIYVGNGKVVEARLWPYGVVKMPFETWDNLVDTKDTIVCLLRVKEQPYELRKAAAHWTEGELGRGWRPMFPWLGKHPDEAIWYCSELVWAAYYNQGVNIDKDDDPSSMTEEEIFSNTVSPGDILGDDDIERIYDGYSVGKKEGVRKSIDFIAHSSVDLIVTDPVYWFAGHTHGNYTAVTPFGYNYDLIVTDPVCTEPEILLASHGFNMIRIVNVDGESVDYDMTINILEEGLEPDNWQPAAYFDFSPDMSGISAMALRRLEPNHRIPILLQRAIRWL
ncbi:hypothetical protein DRN97_05790 [Methanosarcinales archaeon]|nr:MAG: hypothetical protein DRN97_05790 [Methanosarcinales archaeon]